MRVAGLVSLICSYMLFSLVVGDEQTETISGCWEYNIIPYRVGRTFSSVQKQYLRTVISRMNRQIGGCLRWVNMDENFSDAQHYALLYPAKRGCNTKEERGKDGQMVVANISLADNCFEERIIMHQLMHALGFHHEHQRSDRDCYIFVDPSVEHDKNYVKFNQFLQPTMERFPYDKTSVMHFRRSQILKSRSENFILSEPFAPRDFEPIGNWQETLTELDVWKIQYKFCKRKSYCAVWPNECQLDTIYEKKCLNL